ncbi:MAG: AmmeMemoRadiSam system protein B [Nitrospinota bacterium]
MSALPPLRAVEAFPVRQNGATGICLRDPLRYTEAVLFIPMGLIPLLQLIDGTRDLGDIQAEVTRRFATLLPSEEIQGVIDTLDRAYYLDSERFAAHKESVDRRFLDSPVRAPYLAGQAYPESPEELVRMIDGLFLHPEGPGEPDPEARHETPAGAIIPHIDFARGGPAYAHAYRSLVESEPADVYVVLGTAHMGAERVFALTRKDFATPLGTIPADREFIDELVKEAGEDCFMDELSHRAEHSIEFQAVFLRHLLGRNHPISLVPVLCGSMQEFILAGGSPMEDPRVSGFVEGLKKTLAREKRKVCVIASVDLAHVGPRFGHPDPVDAARLTVTQQKDREMLERVQNKDPEAFFGFVRDEQDQRNICGLTPIYTLLHALDCREVSLLLYGISPDPQGTVTFASLLVR